MLLVTLRGLLARKLRLLLTSLAVVLGVAFVAGALFLTDSMRSSFDGLFQEVARQIDVTVRSDEYVDLQQRAMRSQPGTVPIDLTRVGVTPQQVMRIRGVAGVQHVEGRVFEVGAQPLDARGKPVGEFGPPAFAFGWVGTQRSTGALHIVRGRAPGSGEILLDEKSFQDGDFALGDDVDVLIQGGRRRVRSTLVGVLRFGDQSSLNGASITAFDTPTAQRLLDMGDRFSRIDVRAEANVTPAELRDRIRSALGSDTYVITGRQFADEQNDAIDSNFVDILESIILAFAAVAVFVGAFTIFNTFTILVSQRTREFGLLRAIGTERRQVLGIVTIEALVLSVIAATVGIAAGWVLAWLLRELLNGIGFTLPRHPFPLRARTIAWSYGVGLIVTLVASLLPAWRASRLSPLEALRVTTAVRSVGRVIPLLGLLLVVAGSGAAAAALALGEDASIRTVLVRIGAGAALLILGLALLSRLFVAPVARVLGLGLGRGTTGLIAVGNVLRNRVRSATTAAALMIGLALASLVLVFYASLQASVEAEINEAIGGDITVYNSSFGGAPPSVSDTVVERIRGVEGVSKLATSRLGGTMIGDRYRTKGGQTYNVAAFSEGGLGEGGLLRLGIVAGASEPGDDGVLVDENLATARSLDVGDVLQLAFSTNSTRSLHVRGIYDVNQVVGAPIIVSVRTFDAVQPAAQQAARSVVIRTTRGTKPTVVVERIMRTLGDDAAALEVLDNEELAASFRRQLAPILGLVFGMLSLSLVIALLGIGNTMALNVFERTREIGLLRAVGGTRSQLRRIIRVESVIVALFGALVGVVVGVASGAAIIAALRGEGFVFAPNGPGLAAVVLVGFAAGIVASILPARRAARIDVLRAIATD